MARADACRGGGAQAPTVADHTAATERVECRKDAGVVDETPAAYKDIDAVMAAQGELVEVVATLKQVALRARRGEREKTGGSSGIRRAQRNSNGI